MSPPLPTTPHARRDGFPTFLDTLNQRYGLEIPVPQDWSPVTRGKKTSPPLAVLNGLRNLYYGHRPLLEDILANFEEWIAGTSESPRTRQRWSFERWSFEPHVPNKDKVRDERVQYLQHLIGDQLYFLNNSPSFSNKRTPKNPRENIPGFSPKKRRIFAEDEDEYHTAPNSPVKGDQPVTPDLMQLDISGHGEPNFSRQNSETETKRATTFMERLTASQSAPRSDSTRRYDAPPPVMDAINTSFSTVTSSTLFSSHSTRLGESFETDITNPIGTQSTYADSVVGMFIEQEMSMNAGMPALDGKADSL
jgi:hypothetical protein